MQEIVKSGFVENDRLEDYLFCPPLYVVQDWIREEKNIDILVDKVSSCKEYYYRYETPECVCDACDDTFPSYYEALKAGIELIISDFLTKKTTDG